MLFDHKWSELTDSEKDQAKDKYGSKQGWQDAKARAEGYKDEQDRRGNSGEQHAANNSSSTASAPAPSPTPTSDAFPTTSTSVGPVAPSSSGSNKDKDKDKDKTPEPGFQTAATTPSVGPVAPSSDKGYNKRYDLKWSELSDKQKEKSGSKAEHKARRKELGLYGNDKDNSSNVIFSSSAFDNVKDEPFEGPLLPDGTVGPSGLTPSDLGYPSGGSSNQNESKQEEAAQDFLGDFMNNQFSYDDSELQNKYDTLSANYDQLQASFNDLNRNFTDYMNQQQSAPQEEAATESGPMNTGSEQNNPFGNNSGTSPFTSSLDTGSVDSYLENFQGIEITPYQSTTPSSYTTEATTNPTNFTGYQPQVYTPAMHYGTGNENSVAEQQQMYVSEGGQGFYGAPQVTPTNPFTGEAYELDENGLPQLPNNFLYGPGTLLPGQLTPTKGIGT